MTEAKQAGPQPAATPLTAAEAARRLKITGHRGARGIAPENTLASYQVAMDLGVDMLELDVHLSRDGELLVMHDPHVERTTDGSGPIGGFTVAEAKQLNAAAKFAGSVDYGVQRIPVLQEVYDLVQGRCRVNVEIKLTADNVRYPGIEAKVVEVVRRNHAIDNTVISCFDFPTLKAIHELEPRLTRHGIVSRPYFERLAAQGKGAQDAVDEFVDLGVSWMAVNHALLTQDLVTRMKRAGLIVHAWVIDDLEGMIKFASMGVDQITTDRPDILLAARR